MSYSLPADSIGGRPWLHFPELTQTWLYLQDSINKENDQTPDGAFDGCDEDPEGEEEDYQKVEQ